MTREIERNGNEDNGRKIGAIGLIQIRHFTILNLLIEKYLLEQKTMAIQLITY